MTPSEESLKEANEIVERWEADLMKPRPHDYITPYIAEALDKYKAEIKELKSDTDSVTGLVSKFPNLYEYTSQMEKEISTLKAQVKEKDEKELVWLKREQDWDKEFVEKMNRISSLLEKLGKAREALKGMLKITAEEWGDRGLKHPAIADECNLAKEILEQIGEV